MTKTEIFIEKAINIHGDKYDYYNSEYLTSKLKVKVFCKYHNEIFFITPGHHINRKQGCPKCANNFKLTNARFIEKSINIHFDKYDYSKVECLGNKIKVKIICKKHGPFSQSPNSHLKGNGCPKCGLYNKALNKTSNLQKFIEKAKNNIWYDKYDYSNTIYINAREKIEIICKKHGPFTVMPYNHLYGSGCPKCSVSKGEQEIIKILENNNIEYIFQKKYDDCLSNKNSILKFDFYLPDHNLCIEYDGIQHFEAIGWFGGDKSLKTSRERDKIKDDYCNINNINLLRIPYYEYKNIENIIKDKLNI